MNPDRIYTDENNKQWLLDDSGKFLLDEYGDKIPPSRSKPNESYGFTTYDTSQGHCGLCGSIRCRGTCFK